MAAAASLHGPQLHQQKVNVLSSQYRSPVIAWLHAEAGKLYEAGELCIQDVARLECPMR